MPKISILSSVYNGEKYLENSVKSVLEQSLDDFNFFIVDDASTDSTQDRLQSFKDNRLKLFRNDKNLGLTKSLNNLLDFCEGEFIARIDLDDFICKDRLKNQIEFLENNKNFGMATSCYKAINEDKEELYTHCPSFDPHVLKWSLIFRNNIRHSTVMWRRDLDVLYDESFEYAQDYELWCRIAQKTNIGMVRDTTTEITCHNEAISLKFYQEQERYATTITKRQCEFYLNKELTLDEAKSLRLFYFLKNEQQFKDFENIGLEELNLATKNYLDLLICFTKKENINVLQLEEELDKDLRSIKQRKDNISESFSVALQEWSIQNQCQEVKKMIEKHIW